MLAHRFRINDTEPMTHWDTFAAAARRVPRAYEDRDGSFVMPTSTGSRRIRQDPANGMVLLEVSTRVPVHTVRGYLAMSPWRWLRALCGDDRPDPN